MSRVPQEPNRRPRLAPAAALVTLALALTGCGAGQNAQTEVEPAVNGTLGQAGPIMIRDAQFAAPPDGVFPSGGSAPLVLTIVNTGGADDELVEVSSPVAGPAADIRGDRTLVARRTIEVGTPGRIAGSESSVTVTTTTTRSSSPPPPTPPSGSASTSHSSTASGSASQEPVQIGKATIVLTGLTEPLYSGKTYPVTFTFRNAGSVTLNLPIAPPPTARTKSTTSG